MEKEEEPLPGSFYCPITTDVMIDPVIASDGFSYERIAIQTWLAEHKTSPKTGMLLNNCQLIANHSLRMVIEEVTRRKNPLSFTSVVTHTAVSYKAKDAEKKENFGLVRSREFNCKTHAPDVGDCFVGTFTQVFDHHDMFAKSIWHCNMVIDGKYTVENAGNQSKTFVDVTWKWEKHTQIFDPPFETLREESQLKQWCGTLLANLDKVHISKATGVFFSNGVLELRSVGKSDVGNGDYLLQFPPHDAGDHNNNNSIITGFFFIRKFGQYDALQGSSLFNDAIEFISGRGNFCLEKKT